LSRVVEGALLLSLRLRELLIFYNRFWFQRAEPVGPVAARVLLPLQRFFSTAFLMKF